MSIKDALKPLEEELWRIDRRAENLPTEYSVAVLGLGGVGVRTFNELTHIPYIKKFFLVSRNSEKAEATRRSYLGKVLPVETLTYETLPNRIKDNEIDIAIVCVDGETNYKERIKKKEKIDRLDFLYPNIPPIKFVAQSLQGFKGHTIIVTNPVDTMAYLFAYYSDIDPSFITGLNHTDTMRLRKVVTDIFTSWEVEGEELGKIVTYAVGSHSEKFIPIYRSFEGLPLSKLTWYKNKENLLMVRESVAKYGSEQTRILGGTSEETARAIREVVKAIIDQKDDVTASVFIEPKYLGFMRRRELLELFTGYPVRFKGLMAIPRLDDRPIEDEFAQREFVTDYENLESTIHTLEAGEDPIIKGRVERSSPIDTFFERKKEKGKKKPLISVPKRLTYDLDLRVLASSHDQVLIWDPNNPNNPEILFENPDRHGISSLLFKEFGGERLLFVGSRLGIYVLDYDSKKKKNVFENTTNSKISSIDVLPADELIVLGTNRYGLFLWKDGEKPFKKAFPNERLNDVRVVKINGKYNIFVAGEKIYRLEPSELIYQLEPSELKVLMTYSDPSETDAFTNILVSEEDIFASHKDLVRFDIKHPDVSKKYQGNVFSVTSFEKAKIYSLDCLIAGSGDNVFLWLEDSPEKPRMVYKKKSGNIINKVKVMKSGRDYFILGAESTFDRGANINIWEFNDTQEPRTLLTGADYSIKTMEVIRK